MNKQFAERMEAYRRFGGIGAVARQYESGKVTHRELAKKLGCSRVTVYNDFVRHFGESRYLEIRRQRKLKQAKNRELDLTQLKTVLKDRLRKSKQDQNQIEVVLEVLQQIESHGIPLIGVIRGKLSLRFHNGVTNVHIRTASVTGNLPEHRLGFHRFRVSSGIRAYDCVVFAVHAENGLTCYVFKTSEISHLKSLALRFKYFERASRYEFARERWRLLINASQS